MFQHNILVNDVLNAVKLKKTNRNHQLHLYQCANCGFKTNDDRVGAMNLLELGKRYITGDDKPKFKITNVNDL